MKRHDTISVTAATARFFPYGNPAYTVSQTRNHLTGERLGMKLERKEPTGSKRNHRELAAGIALISAFAIWTALVQIVDVQPVGPESTDVGFATLNIWFHQVTEVHLQLYTLTDHLSLIPLIACLCFCIMGTIQLAKRKRNELQRKAERAEERTLSYARTVGSIALRFQNGGVEMGIRQRLSQHRLAERDLTVLFGVDR